MSARTRRRLVLASALTWLMPAHVAAQAEPGAVAALDDGQCADGLYSAQELRAVMGIELSVHATSLAREHDAAADVRLRVRAEDCTLAAGRVDADVEIPSRGWRRSTSILLAGPDTHARSRMLALHLAELVRSGLAESGSPTPPDPIVPTPTATEAPPDPETPSDQAPVTRAREWSVGVAVIGTAFAAYGVATLGARAFADLFPLDVAPLMLGLDLSGGGGVGLDALGPIGAGMGEIAASIGVGSIDSALIAAWASAGWAAIWGRTPEGISRTFDGAVVAAGIRAALRVALIDSLMLVLDARLAWYVLGLEVTNEGRPVGGLGGPAIQVAIGTVFDL